MYDFDLDTPDKLAELLPSNLKKTENEAEMKTVDKLTVEILEDII